ncbi:MAG: ATP-binding protein, partial [Anaerolineae bacterium]
MTQRIVVIVFGMAILAASVTALAWERAKPTPGELAARDTSAAASAAADTARAGADMAEAAARSAAAPDREAALTLFLWTLALSGGLAALGVASAGVRAAHLRAAFSVVNLATPQALVSGAGVVVLSGNRAELAPQAIVGPPQVTMLPAPVDFIPERCDMTMWAPGSEPALPVGLAAGGRLIEIPLAGRALITVAGLPGSGKSNMLRSWVAALRRQDALVAVIDGKGGSDYGQDALVEDGDIDAALRDCLAEIDARLGRLRQSGALDWQHAGLTPSVLICDELAVILDGDSGAWRLRALRRIARLGRAPGCIVIGASQMTQAAVIPSELRNLADVLLSFRLSRGEDARAAGVPGAHRLAAVPGRVMVAGLGGDPIECQSFLAPGVNRSTGSQLVYQPVQPEVIPVVNRLVQPAVIPGGDTSTEAIRR